MPARRPASEISAYGMTTLLWTRARVRLTLLASGAGTIAVAVVTVVLVGSVLADAVAVAAASPPPGMPDEQVRAELVAGTRALTAAAPALWLLVALLAGTAVAQIARLLAAAREHETRTLQARGTSRAQSRGMDAVEGAAVGLIGAAIGILLGAGFAPLVGARPEAALAWWPVALATAALMALVFVIALRRAARRGSSTRGAKLTALGLVGVVIAAAGLVAWQLPAARPGAADPIVAVAPAVVLAAAALGALALFGVAVPLVARAAAAGSGASPSLPARQVARRVGVTAVAVLLVALAAAQTVFAAAYMRTWESSATVAAGQRAGADLRVDMDPQSARPADVAAAAAVDGIDAATPALIASVEIGETDAELIATGDRPSASGAVPAVATATANALPIDADATGIRVVARVTSSAATSAAGLRSVDLTVVLLDAVGTPASVSLSGPTVVVDGGLTVTAEAALPAGSGPWSLLAVVAGAGASFFSREADVAIVDVEATGAGGSVVGSLAAGGTVALGGDDGTAAVLWPQVEQPLPVAAVVSRGLAERLGIGIGAEFEFRYEGTGRRSQIVVADVVDVVPGASGPLALATALDELLASQLQRDPSVTPADSVWAEGETDAAAALSAALGDRLVLTAQPTTAATVVGALRSGWWITTIGAVVLTLIAAVAIVRTLAAARRSELGVLRALGVTAGRQARLRAGELAATFTAALLLGVAGGGLAAAFVVPGLVSAVTPGVTASAVEFGVAWMPGGALLAVLALGLGAVTLLAAAAVGRGAQTALIREDAR